jgi:DNA-binding transcriptional ArsR family regulator
MVTKEYMRTKTQERLRAQAQVLKALAHPTRLLLVEELARKTKCVCELTDAAGLDISTVSKHLSLLRNAGIVEDEKRGLKVFYSLKTPCVLNFFKCVESVRKCSK